MRAYCDEKGADGDIADVDGGRKQKPRSQPSFLQCTTMQGVHSILARGSMPPCLALKIFRKLLFFACFRFLTFHPFFQGRGSADPICPYVRTPMTTVLAMLAVGPFICSSELHRDYETVAILPQLGVWWGGVMFRPVFVCLSLCLLVA